MQFNSLYFVLNCKYVASSVQSSASNIQHSGVIHSMILSSLQWLGVSHVESRVACSVSYSMLRLFKTLVFSVQHSVLVFSLEYDIMNIRYSVSISQHLACSNSQWISIAQQLVVTNVHSVLDPSKQYLVYSSVKNLIASLNCVCLYLLFVCSVLVDHCQCVLAFSKLHLMLSVLYAVDSVQHSVLVSNMLCIVSATSYSILVSTIYNLTGVLILASAQRLASSTYNVTSSTLYIVCSFQYLVAAASG